MTLSKADRKTLNDICDQIEAHLFAGGEIDPDALSSQIEAMQTDDRKLERLLDRAAHEVADIANADTDEEVDEYDQFCGAAINAIADALKYRKTPVRKAKKATGRAGIEVVMIDETTGWLCL